MAFLCQGITREFEIFYVRTAAGEVRQASCSKRLRKLRLKGLLHLFVLSSSELSNRLFHLILKILVDLSIVAEKSVVSLASCLHFGHFALFSVIVAENNCNSLATLHLSHIYSKHSPSQSAHATNLPTDRPTYRPTDLPTYLPTYGGQYGKNPLDKVGTNNEPNQVTTGGTQKNKFSDMKTFSIFAAEF